MVAHSKLHEKTGLAAAGPVFCMVVLWRSDRTKHPIACRQKKPLGRNAFRELWQRSLFVPDLLAYDILSGREIRVGQMISDQDGLVITCLGRQVFSSGV